MNKKRMIIAISAASGPQLGIALLKAMKNFPDWETHLIISTNSYKTITIESNYTPEEVSALADFAYDAKDVGAPVSSGTFKTDGMVIIPCSMKTLAGVANGYNDNLIIRAADVVIKERRKLVLVPRETPLSPIHLKNMLTLSTIGVTILPPMLTFYNKLNTVDEQIGHIVGKVLDCFDLNLEGFRRWGETH